MLAALQYLICKGCARGSKSRTRKLPDGEKETIEMCADGKHMKISMERMSPSAPNGTNYTAELVLPAPSGRIVPLNAAQRQLKKRKRLGALFPQLQTELLA